MISILGALAARVLPFAASVAPLSALAHPGTDDGGHHGFLAGMLHPLAGADHLAAMVAVGLWSALAARRAWPDLLAAPLGFASMLALGAFAGLYGLGLPAIEPMIAASLLVLGLLVMTRLRLSAAPAGLLVGAFALFHGLAHGHEFAGQPHADLTVAGMLVSTVALHAAGIACGWALRERSRWLPRIAGAGVALFGVALLAGVA
ncbi:urease accessory protein UreJ [Xylophilus rhododendri]|uniref:Urease accessory protein UreJ n=1 Tax=Xylophilus rhododendri TaxID=2697032 RepID=A0A857J6E8_9BURK|nr:HupE/UreJ family protein [Xylophilus rhododendri]QHI99570.1 urease accessory protein UreJ [Xylophilus rhododendri]